MEEMLLLELDLDTLVPEKAPVWAVFERDLGAEDLALLATKRIGPGPKPLQRVRQVHHETARLLATGMSNVLVSSITGLSPNRITELLGDTSFKELLTVYSRTEERRFSETQDELVVVRKQMLALGQTASQELLERLEQAPEEFSHKELRELIKVSMDRGGNAPIRQTEHRELRFSRSELVEIKQEVQARAPTVAKDSGAAVEGEFEPVGSPWVKEEAPPRITLEGIGL